MIEEYSSEPYYSEDNFNETELSDKGKKENKIVLELFAGLVLIVLLILMSVLFISLADAKSSSTSTVVSNSYNVNSFNTNTKTIEPIIPVVYKKTLVVYKKSYVYYDSPKYYSVGVHKTSKRIFSDDTDNFGVYVLNDNYNSGYFSVRFYLTDFSGKVNMEKMTKYIRAGDEEVFSYKSISPYDSKFYSWHYEVIPESLVLKNYKTKIITEPSYKVVSGHKVVRVYN